MKHLLILSLLIFTCLNSTAVAEICKKDDADKKSFINLSQFITAHPVKNNILSSDQVKVGQKIMTKENEFTSIAFVKPYKVEFQIYPESEIEILNLGDAECGPQIKLNTGRILSTGHHPVVKDPMATHAAVRSGILSQNPVAEKCPFEIETEEAYIQPTGTSYLVESGALSDAIAELNGEAAGESSLVGVGETGTLEEGSFEKYSVKKGTIKIRLKRISKNKLQNKIKYTQAVNNKKSKTKKSVAKNSKNKIRFLAYNEKIKLGAKSSLSVKRK